MYGAKIVFLTGLAAGLFGQTADLRFEAASVKPGQEGRPQGVWTDGPLRLRVQRLTLKALIANAYEMRGYQVFGPGWIDTARFDVMAKLPDSAGRVSEAERTRQTAAMMRALLAERFQLAVHRETRDLPVTVLTVAKDGLKIRKTGEDHGDLVRVDYRAGHLVGQQMPMRQLVSILTSALHQPVIDGTGFEGLTDIKLEWTPEEDGDNPLSNALHQQLGLKLEEQKRPTETIVIDKVEKLSEN